MSNPSLQVASAVIGVGTGIMSSESALLTPKTIVLFYIKIAVEIKIETINCM